MVSLANDWAGLFQELGLFKIGDTEQRLEYSPDYQLTYTYSPTITKKESRVLYYAPVLVIDSPGATASPQYIEATEISPSTVTTPQIKESRKEARSKTTDTSSLVLLGGMALIGIYLLKGLGGGKK